MSDIIKLVVNYSDTYTLYSSKISEHASIWLDSYFAWIDPRSGCCKVHNRNATNVTRCHPSDSNYASKFVMYCGSVCEWVWCNVCIGSHDVHASLIIIHLFTDCESCIVEGENLNRPNVEQFMQYLPWFLTSNPDTHTCNQGWALLCTWSPTSAVLFCVVDMQHFIVQ